MKWGVFSLSQIPDQSKRVETMAGDMEQFELAEDLGYDKVWIAEHLFSTYGIVTSTQVLAAAIAQRVKRMRIGMAVVVIPFNHPLRTAADFALIDILSNGRLDFGVGRAYQQHEFTGLNLPMEKSRAMFKEGLDIVLKAWTNERITYEGEFWTIPEPTEILPKPIQTPHPPVYQATISPESFAAAAEDGWNLQLAAPFSYRIYREQWKDKLQENIEGYATQARQHGHDPDKIGRMMLLPFFCDETTEKAKARYAPHVEWFYNKVSAHTVSTKGDDQVVAGYELGMREGARTRELGLLSFDNLQKYAAAVVGDPDHCIAELRDMKQRFGVTEFVLWFNLGGMPSEEAKRSMKLTMEKVIPYV